jgi:hypothetical protein
MKIAWSVLIYVLIANDFNGAESPAEEWRSRLESKVFTLTTPREFFRIATHLSHSNDWADRFDAAYLIAYGFDSGLIDEQLKVLNALLEDQDERVVQEAIRALVPFGGHAVKLLPKVRALKDKQTGETRRLAEKAIVDLEAFAKSK